MSTLHDILRYPHVTEKSTLKKGINLRLVPMLNRFFLCMSTTVKNALTTCEVCLPSPSGTNVESD